MKTLNPGYFALVMATGIISIGLRMNGWNEISVALLVIGVCAYLVLVTLYVTRFVKYREQMVDDFLDPSKAFAFFTFIAGTNVLGTRLVLQGLVTLGLCLLGLSILSFLILGYAIPWASFLGRAKHPILRKANGTWFIWTVAAQSIAVLAATLQPHFAPVAREFAMVGVGFWAIGLFIYAGVGICILLRILLYDIDAKDFAAPYWVSMGALAITILAGGKITEMLDAPMVDATRGVVTGTSALCWSIATWLIVPLLAIGWWRHVTNRIPLRYEPPLWSMVFPVGMYGVSSQTIGEAAHLPVVFAIGHYEVWVAVAVWLIVFIGLLRTLAMTVFVSPKQTS
ncbi:MAG: tellurite resistance/C4-dicarboxylate transporter family protein [Candidatus Nanopelagicales bacterium]|nr:tellurite resistance/C4-dicarboxylate transporter family protein [Candidatus Nanopelagicales bacterium]MDZ4250464.1 tellurite resistance/C4-dicarboxylate transporter family protein [Candidatus Nanopelagicales bacterium]